MAKQVKVKKPIRYKTKRGRLIGWKWGWLRNEKTGRMDYALIKLSIPAHAHVICGILKERRPEPRYKRRASEAKVLGIWRVKSDKQHRPVVGGKHRKAEADYNGMFIYEVGKVVRPEHGFCDDTSQQCASGIHFFLIKREALQRSFG